MGTLPFIIIVLTFYFFYSSFLLYPSGFFLGNGYGDDYFLDFVYYFVSTDLPGLVCFMAFWPASLETAFFVIFTSFTTVTFDLDKLLVTWVGGDVFLTLTYFSFFIALTETRALALTELLSTDTLT